LVRQREIAAKALTLPPISFRSEAHIAFPSQRFAIAIEDTRMESPCSITFLALFHLFRASINCLFRAFINRGFPLLFLRCIPAKYASCIARGLLLYLVSCPTMVGGPKLKVLNTAAVLLSLPQRKLRRNLVIFR